MDGFTKRLHAHRAKLLTCEAMTAPREAHVEGSIQYHKDAIRHIERIIGRPALPTVDNPRDE
jgi:hypothetical protein